jgi:hypothetical protein
VRPPCLRPRHSRRPHVGSVDGDTSGFRRRPRRRSQMHDAAQTQLSSVPKKKTLLHWSCHAAISLGGKSAAQPWNAASTRLRHPSHAKAPAAPHRSTGRAYAHAQEPHGDLALPFTVPALPGCPQNTGDNLRSSEVHQASSASSPCSAAPSATIASFTRLALLPPCRSLPA